MQSPNIVSQSFKPSFLLLVLIAMILITGTSNNRKESTGDAMTTKSVTEVLEEHTQELMSIPGVVGVAQGLCDGTPCIKLFLSEMVPEVRQKIPSFLEGYPVMVEETGKIHALPEKQK